MEENTTIRTKFGNIYWVSVVFLIALCAAIAVLLLLLRSTVLIILPICVCVGGIALITIAGFYTRYSFENDRLVVKCPLATDEPPAIYSEVKRIDTKPRWAYILGYSSDSISIWYGKNSFVCISPPNKDECIQFLKEHCPDAKFEIEE